MTIIGTVESVWRYPVKSMRGEEPGELFLGYAGIYGDRLFAFTQAAGPAIFPYLTGRELAEMLRYRPRFRHSEQHVTIVMTPARTRGLYNIALLRRSITAKE